MRLPSIAGLSVLALVLSVALTACGTQTATQPSRQQPSEVSPVLDEPEIYVANGKRTRRLDTHSAEYQEALRIFDGVRASDTGVGINLGFNSVRSVRGLNEATRSPLGGLPFLGQGETAVTPGAIRPGCLIWYRSGPHRLNFPRDGMSSLPHFEETMRDTGRVAWRARRGTDLNVHAVFIPADPANRGYVAEFVGSQSARGIAPDSPQPADVRSFFVGERAYDTQRIKAGKLVGELVDAVLGK